MLMFSLNFNKTHNNLMAMMKFAILYKALNLNLLYNFLLMPIKKNKKFMKTLKISQILFCRMLILYIKRK